MPWFDYRIAAGHAVALGGLTNIESLAITGEKNLKIAGSYGTYDYGQEKIRGDGLIYHSGFGTCELIIPGITRGQYAYLSTTYCSGGRSGEVTIYVRTIAAGTYARYNATMILPKFSEMQRKPRGFAGCNIRFTRMVAL